MRHFHYFVIFFMVGIGVSLHDQGYNPCELTGIPEVEERLVSHDKGMQTEYYVLVAGEILVVADNYRYGAYDNFSRVNSLKEAQKEQRPVTVTVVGHGKSLFYNYRNIVLVK